MTDIEKALESAKPERSRRRLPIAWLVLTGILILLNLITLAVGRYKENHIKLAMNDLKKQQAAAIQQLQQQQAAQTKELIKQQGESIARSFQMVNPQLLTDRGQQKALSFFANLYASNNHIKYIALYDANGVMCATSNLFLGNVAIPAGMTDEVISKKGIADADVEFFGPITDSNDRRIGTVLIGLSFAGKDSATPVAKPNAVAPEDAEPVPPPAAQPPAATAPPMTTPSDAAAPSAAPEAPAADSGTLEPITQ